MLSKTRTHPTTPQNELNTPQNLIKEENQAPVSDWPQSEYRPKPARAIRPEIEDEPDFLIRPTPAKDEIIEDIKVEDTKALNESVHENPAETKEPDDKLYYFESKDPEPKKIAPVGGTGPALTKTLVKPQVKPAESKPEPAELPEVSPPEAKSEPEQEPELNDDDAEELRKLEEEVARLQKEAEGALEGADGDAPGEFVVIDEQSVIVDGKRKKKKKKKKKRRKIGGGEETIANITIDEVSVEEDQVKKDLDLNPPQKKKKKKLK